MNRNCLSYAYVSNVQIGTHWDFLPKILSLHYNTTLEDVFGVQRSGKAQETIICLLCLLFFSQNEMKFKKPTKTIKIHWIVFLFFWNIFRVCSILAGKQRSKSNRWTKVDHTASFDTQDIARGGIIVEVSCFLQFLFFENFWLVAPPSIFFHYFQNKDQFPLAWF